MTSMSNTNNNMISVNVTLTPKLKKQIDRERGKDVSRSAFIRAVLDSADLSAKSTKEHAKDVQKLARSLQFKGLHTGKSKGKVTVKNG